MYSIRIYLCIAFLFVLWAGGLNYSINYCHCHSVETCRTEVIHFGSMLPYLKGH